jgi:hypothetical protein
MRITNKLGLPAAIVAAVTNDGYTKGDADISITGLLKPARVAGLEKQHADELEEDVSDRIFALLGQVTHSILERAALVAPTEGVNSEKRLYVTVEGWRVSGQMDRVVILEGLLQDYKLVSIYKLKDGVPPEYEQQLNLYAELLRQNGQLVKKLQIVGIYRDWSKSAADRDEEYPQSQVQVFTAPMWPQEKAQRFLRERVLAHQAARSGVLPLCSDEERWAKPPVYAVMQQGRKSAVKLCTSESEAMGLVGSDSKRSVQFRPGKNTRCDSFCSVAKFCQQYQSMKKGDESNE